MKGAFVLHILYFICHIQKRSGRELEDGVRKNEKRGESG